MSRVVEAYEGFVLENSETIGYAETFLQTACNLTPSRFGNNEKITEACEGVGEGLMGMAC